LEFSRDGKYLMSRLVVIPAGVVTKWGDPILHIQTICWNFETGEKMNTQAIRYVEEAGFSTLSPDGRFFATTTNTGIKITDPLTGSVIARFPNLVRSVRSLPSRYDHTLINVSGRNQWKWGGAVTTLDLGKGEFYFPARERLASGSTVTLDSLPIICVTDECINQKGFLPVEFWDYQKKRLVSRTLPQILTGRSLQDNYCVSNFHITRNGNYLVYNLADGVKVLDARTGILLRKFKYADLGLYDLSSDGKRALFGGRQSEQSWRLSVCELATGKELYHKDGEGDQPTDPQFSPDGKAVIYGSYRFLNPAEEARSWVIDIWKPEQDALQTLTTSANEIVAMSHNGKYIAGARRKVRFELISVQSGEGLFEVRSLDEFNSLRFSRDDRWLITAGQDGKTLFWDTQSGKLVATLVIFIDRDVSYDKQTLETTESFVGADFIVYSPDNYYMASRGAHRGIGFRILNKIFPFEQFDLKFNRPDIILKTLGYAPLELIEAYHTAYQKRLKKMGFTEGMLSDDIHLPEVSIADVVPASTADSVLSFRVKLSDSKYLLDRILVSINDVPVHGTSGINLRDKNVSALEYTLAVPLLAGRNKVQVSLFNQKGAESLKETFEVVRDSPPVKPDLYVIAIGVSSYQQSEFSLKYAAKDAEDLAHLLEKQRGQFAQIKSLKLINEEATREKILSTKDFLMQSKVDDQVILFVAGHGLLDDKLDWYFATHDVDFENPSARGVSYDELEGLLDGIPARKKLFLMDACHSGEVDKEASVLITANITDGGAVKSRGFKGKKVEKKSLGLQNSFELMQQLFADLNKGTGAMVISSAGGAEYAFESSEWNNGVFTYSLLEGMKTKNADKNKDGQIMVSELRDYVIDKVQNLTEGKQRPTSRKENLEFDFKVW
jgi:uncharacterized caspase-like protein